MVYYSTYSQLQKLLKNITHHEQKNLVLKLPKPPNNFVMESVNNYYEKCNLKEELIFANIR